MRLATCMGWSTAPFFTLLRWPIQRVQDPQICKIYSRHNINGIYRRSVTHACKSTINASCRFMRSSAWQPVRARSCSCVCSQLARAAYCTRRRTEPGAPGVPRALRGPLHYTYRKTIISIYRRAARVSWSEHTTAWPSCTTGRPTRRTVSRSSAAAAWARSTA